MKLLPMTQLCTRDQITHKLRTIDHSMAFNNEQKPYSLLPMTTTELQALSLGEAHTDCCGVNHIRGSLTPLT